MSDPLIMQAIARLVPEGARVLDLGCGDGALLAYLQEHKGCTGYGVELDDANVLACAQRGVNVLQLNLDQGLAGLAGFSAGSASKPKKLIWSVLLMPALFQQTQIGSLSVELDPQIHRQLDPDGHFGQIGRAHV